MVNKYDKLGSLKRIKNNISEMALLRSNFCILYPMFARIQHISILVIADVYKAFKFNFSAISSVSFQKGNILQSKQMSINDLFTTVSGICGVYFVFVCSCYIPLHVL